MFLFLLSPYCNISNQSHYFNIVLFFLMLHIAWDYCSTMHFCREKFIHFPLIHNAFLSIPFQYTLFHMNLSLTPHILSYLSTFFHSILYPPCWFLQLKTSAFFLHHNPFHHQALPILTVDNPLTHQESIPFLTTFSQLVYSPFILVIFSLSQLPPQPI